MDVVPHDAVLVEGAEHMWVLTYRDRAGKDLWSQPCGGVWSADAVLSNDGLRTISGWKSWDSRTYQANITPLAPHPVEALSEDMTDKIGEQPENYPESDPPAENPPVQPEGEPWTHQ